MKAIIKEAGKRAHIADIPNTLAALQSLVGGYIETLSIFPRSTFVVNEEGRLLGLPRNGLLDFVGTVLVVGVDCEQFVDLDECQAEELLTYCNFGMKEGL